MWVRSQQLNLHALVHAISPFESPLLMTLEQGARGKTISLWQDNRAIWKQMYYRDSKYSTKRIGYPVSCKELSTPIKADWSATLPIRIVISDCFGSPTCSLVIPR